jgi:hypothetical protein
MEIYSPEVALFITVTWNRPISITYLGNIWVVVWKFDTWLHRYWAAQPCPCSLLCSLGLPNQPITLFLMILVVLIRPHAY